jgi:hypothetical protein
MIELQKALLAQLAANLDAPDGPGSGAVVLDALCLIEDLQRRIDPAEPSTA